MGWPSQQIGASMRKSRLASHPLQAYWSRNYIGHLVDEQWFDLQSDVSVEGPFFAHAIGCLDALDYIPAGSMKHVGSAWYDATVCVRGVTLAEIEAFEAIAEEE